MRVTGADLEQVPRLKFDLEKRTRGPGGERHDAKGAGMSATIGADALRAALLDGEEIALLDVREEAAFGPEHILLAIHLPLSRLELRAA